MDHFTICTQITQADLQTFIYAGLSRNTTYFERFKIYGMKI